MSWYEFDESAIVTCKCEWTGATKDVDLEITGISFYWECPKCGKTMAAFSPR